MSEGIWSALIQVIGGGIFLVIGIFLGRRLEMRDKGRKQIIETGVTTTELVNPDKLGPISMYINEEFITGKPAENGEISPVKSAYNYVIGVSNVGLDDLEKPEIDIILDESAIIVECKAKSDKIPPDKFSIQKDKQKRNFRRIIPEYLNKKDGFEISVLSIENKNPICNVMVGGKGVIHRTRISSLEAESIQRESNNLTIATLVTIIFGSIFTLGALCSGFLISSPYFQDLIKKIFVLPAP